MVEKKRSVLCESLESRTLLAVTAINFDGQKLEVFGDGGNDAVFVTTVGGNLIVNGRNLGSAAKLKDVVIKTGGGDDHVEVNNISIQNTLEIVTGSGDDGVLIGAPVGPIDVFVGNDVKIETEDGEDRIEFDDVDAKTVEIKTGNGVDTLDPRRVTTRNDLKIDMGEGNDVVLARDLDGKKITLDGGTNSDLLRLAGVVAGQLEIKNFEIVIRA